MKRIVVRVSVALLVSACSSVAPVAGRMERGDESFSGTFTGGGFRSGPGELTLVSSHRTTCKGSVVYTSRRKGEGVVNCDDGRTGPVHLSGFDESGSGYGDLAGQRFTFTFGKVS